MRENTATPQNVCDRLTKPEIERLIAACKSGGKVTQLAQQFGVSRETVANHLKRNGFKLTLRALDVEAVERARIFYERDGRSLANIGEEFGVEAATVHRALRRVGVQFRDTHGRLRQNSSMFQARQVPLSPCEAHAMQCSTVVASVVVTCCT